MKSNRIEILELEVGHGIRLANRMRQVTLAGLSSLRTKDIDSIGGTHHCYVTGNLVMSMWQYSVQRMR